jgi:hypothetical protein|nr:MAG TPA: Protein of unknown function (DUF1642) [Caudoviricetes sp.]
MIRTYHKTATIKAEQFDGSNEMIDKYDIEVVEGDYADDYSMPEAGPAPYFRYFMPSGYNEIYVGDWVATGVNGEHWAIADDVFNKTYAELPVIPKNVDYSIKKYKEWNCNLGIVFDDACSGHVWEDGVGEWILEHSDTFARAWLDGYAVE